MAVDPDKPFNREEMYLAKAAGEGTTVPDEPWSRKEAYLDKISGRLDGIDEKIAALATDISLKGSVADYDHLPTDAAVGDAYITEDTGILYVWVGDKWTPLNIEGGGGATELTSDDYDYHRTGSVDDGVALWRLQPGWYIAKANTKTYAHTGLYAASVPDVDCPITIYSLNGDRYIVFAGNQGLLKYYGVTSSGSLKIYTPGRDTLLSSNEIVDNLTSTDVWAPLSANQGKALNDKIEGRVIQNAGAPTTSTVGTVGMLLEDTTNGKLYQCTAITPGTDPDPDTYTWTEVGAGGGGGIITLTSDDYNYPEGAPTSVALWLLSPGYYKADNITVKEDRGDTWSNNSDIWIVGNKNASDYTGILQVGSGAVWAYTTNATSGMASTSNGVSAVLRNKDIYGDSGKTKILIGSNTSSSQGSTVVIGYGASVTNSDSYGGIAIGPSAQVTARGAIAIGDGSKAIAQGELNIGTNNTYRGYNSSNYRLISGVYDGQGIHDAATVAQGNTLSDSAPTTSTVGVLGQLYTDTTNMHTYQCTAISGSTYTWTQRW